MQEEQTTGQFEQGEQERSPSATSETSNPVNPEQEREAILRMIAEGRITPEEGDMLLEFRENSKRDTTRYVNYCKGPEYPSRVLWPLAYHLALIGKPLSGKHKSSHSNEN